MRCVALISGGLDSHLAARVVQQQGVEVEALHFRDHVCGRRRSQRQRSPHGSMCR